MIFNTHYAYVGGGAGKPGFTYTGEYTEIDDGGRNWRIKFLSSGTLVVDKDVEIDAFLVGGGGVGGLHAASSTYRASGGGGGYTKTVKKVKLQAGVSYSIVIGAGGARLGDYQDGRASTAFGYSAEGGKAGTYTNTLSTISGGAGGSGGGGAQRSTTALPGAGGSDGGNGEAVGSYNNGGVGQNVTTREFGESTGELYAGGGGGLNGAGAGAGGAGGGGAGGENGAPNTGGGSGGGGDINLKAGSGVVVIRNAR